MKRLILLALLLASTAQALPQSLREDGAGWRQWGSGEMSWFGIALYRATLWVAGTDPDSAPIALQLDYRRDITRERLVRASVDEMRRLGSDPAQLPRWEAELRRVFADVRAGETIVGVHYPGRGAAFYHRDQPSGFVADAEFARRFFAIWLDPDSRSPALRTALLTPPRG